MRTTMCKSTLIFRVDGNAQVGLGHITRCCALADMLKNDFNIYFYTRVTAQTIIDDIKNYCIDVIFLNDDISYEEEGLQWVSFLKGDEIVVLDGYNFITAYQQPIKNKGCKLLCIDDLHAYHFIADVVINHAPGIDKNAYACETYTQLYLGTEYVLLKKIFLEATKNTLTTFELTTSPVLICFGGADPNDVTRDTLDKALPLFPDKNLHVVVGAAYMHLQRLKAFIQNNKQVSLHINIKPEEMLSLMQQSHIAVTSASTIALEYMCARGNLFLKCIADNQKDIYQSLIDMKAAYAFEEIEYQYNNTSIINNQYKLIDGRSADRLLKIFKGLANSNESIIFKRVMPEDVDLLFNWINDPEVRAQSLSSHSIQYSEHINWFSKKLSDKNCFLYVAYKNQQPVGMLRFDVSANNCMISYLVDNLQRGKNIGTSIIREGLKHFMNESSFQGVLEAAVKKINIPSIKIFEKAGFEINSVEEDLIHFKKSI